MGILLGLLTALSWGSSDFLARFATTRIGTLRAMLYMQLTGFILLTIFMPWLGGWGHLADGSGWQPWAWGALVGTVNAGSTLMLYRSFEIGKMSVVAPISASYPGVTVVLSFLSGERLTAPRAMGIVCILLGVIVVAAGEKVSTGDDPEAIRRRGKGLGWAIGSGIGFGTLFWLLGSYAVPRVGTAGTVWMIRLTSVALTFIAILLAKQPLGMPRDKKSIGLVGAMGVLDTGAFVLNNRGMLLDQISIVSVLASLYGAVTVALAALFLREHVSRRQWLGIVAIFAGIFLISRL